MNDQQFELIRTSKVLYQLRIKLKISFHFLIILDFFQTLTAEKDSSRLELAWSRVLDFVAIKKVSILGIPSSLFWRETRLPFRYWGPSQKLCPRPCTRPHKIPPFLLEGPEFF